MGAFWHDLRHGARLLARNPGFTIIAVVTLALGIGGSTAIFSVVDSVLLRPLPYRKPDQIVRVFEVTEHGDHSRLSDPDFQAYRQQVSGFFGLAEYNSDLEPILGGTEPTLATVAAVSQDFFKVMGVEPTLGRELLPSELHEGGAPAVLVSYAFWQRFLGGERDFGSRHLSVSGHLVTIVGVMPPGFSFPGDTEIWFPREISSVSTYPTGHNWLGIGRLKDGVSLATAQAEANSVAQRLRQQYGEMADVKGVTLVRLQEEMVGSTRPALLILLGAVGLLLLVACANVANLLLAQAARRQRELAVRVALGANRSQLISQFVAEALLLSGAGSVLGFPVATWAVRILVAIEPGKLPRAHEIGVHPGVIGFAAGVAVLTALGLGVVTALRAFTDEVQESLKGGERTQTGGASSHRMRLLLMGAQVAVTLVLLIGAGLLARSLFRLLSVHAGFRTDHVVTMDLLDVWPDTPAEKTHLVEVLSGLIQRLGAVPGIESVGVVSALPLTGLGSHGGYLVMRGNETFSSLNEFARVYMGLTHDPSRTGQAEYRVASTGYFRAMGIPLLRGRLFEASDGPDSPHVAVVSQSFANKQWPGENPLGQQIEFGNMDLDLRPFTVVGVVGDVRDRSLDAGSLPTLYSCYRQRRSNNFTVVIQTTRPSAEIVPIARQIEREIEPDLPARFGTIRKIVSASVADEQFNVLLLGIFALTALLVALMGVYGVGSYLVSQRTKEIGIRMALGAQKGDVVRMITGEGLRVILAAAVVGVGGALALARVLASLLFGVTAADPLTFIAVVVLVVVTGLAACYVPARRAAQIDPMAALREP
ncbi:MAG: ABC transporter permease [Acidobacteriota bacterium]|nr:ABC transporter permease [Acidobacteriota bacterium]